MCGYVFLSCPPHPLSPFELNKSRFCSDIKLRFSHPTTHGGLVFLALVYNGYGRRKRTRTRHMYYFSRANLPLSLYVVFATLHAVGFRAVLPLCDGKAQGPPSQRWGRTQQLGVGGCCTRNRAARWDSHRLVPLFVESSLLLLLLLLCSGGTASPPRPEPTSQPGPQLARPHSRGVVMVVVGLRGPSGLV